MNHKDIWYGVLEAGEKTSPVVRDISMDASKGKTWLYNYSRNQFIEYAEAIVEPKLRKLAASDISMDELDKAFQAARKEFASLYKADKWTDNKAAVPPSRKSDDEDGIDTEMPEEDDMEEFIDDE